MTKKQTSSSVMTKAVQLLQAGEVVVFPTETVYGLGCDATCESAVAKVFVLKNRPAFNPLIVHFAEMADLSAHVVVDARVQALAKAFWPGPLTLVLARKPLSSISLLATAGLDTIAVRIPRHAMARDLIQAAGCPVAAPSANRSGFLSPTHPEHVAKAFGENGPLILDGGPCEVGLESTVIDLSTDTPVLLRAGGLDLKTIEATLGQAVASCAHNPHLPKSPGQMLQHYATRTPLRNHASYVRSTEGLLAFGKHEPAGAAMTLNLSLRGDVQEAAANFFAMLYQLDQGGFSGIAVVPIPEEGLGLAINDRLRRAAAPLS